MKRLLTFLTLLTVFIGVGWAETITVDFEGNSIPSGWTASKFTVVSNPISNSSSTNGSYCASTAGSSTDVTLTYNTKLTGVTSISIDAAKTTNNSNGSMNIEFSTDNTNWDNAEFVTATIARNSWTTTTLTLAQATDGYVRISFSGTTAVKFIDNIVINYGASTPTEKVATPTFNPAEGTYTSAQNVTINCETSGATIYYTTNGSAPTTSSSVYSGAIPVGSTTTIKALAVKSGMSNSDVASATYTINLPTTTTTFERVTSISSADIGKRFIIVSESAGLALDNSGANKNNGTSVSITSHQTTISSDASVGIFTLGNGTEGYTFAYSANDFMTLGNSSTGLGHGSTAADLSITFDDGNSIIASISNNRRIACYSSQDFRTYTSWSTGQEVQLYKEVENVVQVDDLYLIGYGMNGTEGWNLTTAPQMTYSNNAGTYAVDVYFDKAQRGMFQFAKGLSDSNSNWDGLTGRLYPSTNGSNVSVDAYDMDGTVGLYFTDNSNMYSFELPAGLYTITANLSEWKTYVEQHEVTMTATANGYFDDSKNVTLSSNLTAAPYNGKIYYTTDGTDPKTSSTRQEYTGTLSFTETTTLKAVAELGYIYSEVVERTYTKTPAAPVITPASCTFNEPLTVNITAESGATIYYTTDGSNPTSSNGTQYTGSFTVSATTTVKARAYVGEVYSSIAEATYTYSNVQPSTGDFQLVTSTSDLVAGREYIILTSNGSYAMGALTGSNPKGSQVTDFTLNGTTVTAGSTVNILTLGGSEGAWTLKQSDESYITLGTNTNISSSSSTCALTINISNNVATIQGPNSGPSASTPRQILHQAGSSNCFGNYASSNVGESNYTTVYLYYRGSTNITPVFTPAPGLFNIDVDVTISTSTDGATIYYTTDGSDPKTSSTRQEYTSEIIVSETTTFKAYAVKDGDESEVVEATYTINKSTTPETVTPTYRESFTTGDGIGKFLVSNESGFSPVWTLDGNYGVKGTAYSPNTSPTNNIATSWLLSPYIDLTGCVTPEMTFAHQINSYFNDVTTQATLWVREITNGTPGEWAQLTVNFSTPASESWTNDVATYDLTNYIDKTIQFGFKYMTTENSGAGTWEIQNFVVSDEVVLVNNIAEFKALENGTKAKFKNPVTVLYDYAQYSNNSYHEYIWFKDESGYCQFYLLPTLNSTTDTYSTTAKYENGDIIPAGFTVTRNYYTYGDYMQAYSDDALNAGFQNTDQKGLADPDHYTFTTLNALQVNETDIAQHCNRYIYIPKIKITSKSGKDFDFTDESGATNKIVGFNKFSDASSLQKDGSSAVVTVPDAGNTYYNVKAILQLWKGSGSATKWEILPIEFEPWAEKTVTLRELCKDGVTTEGENEYTISNNLLGVYASADGTKLWVKDASGQSIWMASPVDGDLNFEVYAEAADGVPANTRLEQAYYDQSNWCEIHLTGANAAAFKGQIIKGGSIHGKYTDDLNPTLENVALTTDDIYSAGSYAPNYYMPANFTGRQQCTNGSHSTDFEAYYFFMTPKPQEYAQVVWAVWNSQNQKFIMSTSDNDNGHRFEGEFAINLEMNDGVSQTSQITDGYGYNFKAIMRKTSSKAGGYMVYPLDLDEGINPATAIESVVAGNGEVKSVKYVNVAGIVSDVPFQGVNIVVTEYTDGSRTTTKMLKK